MFPGLAEQKLHIDPNRMRIFTKKRNNRKVVCFRYLQNAAELRVLCFALLILAVSRSRGL